jgi:hypothetical protein
MNNVVEKARQYHEQFQNASTDNERQLLASAYKSYYAQLSAEDKAEADKVHDAHFAKTRQKVDEFEPMLQRAKDMLRQHKQPTA